MSLFDSPITVGLLLGIPSAVLGYLGYKRAKKSDETAAETGNIGQVIAGLNLIVDSYQADNASLRARLDVLQARLEQCMADREDLKARLLAAEQKYGK